MKSVSKKPGRLCDGLHTFKAGRKRPQLYVRDGVMWMPAEMLPPLALLISEKALILADDHKGITRCFMRASDMIELLPGRKEVIESIAQKHGLKL